MRVDHALLGYDRGHRVIASSMPLTSRSKHVLLQLSDRSAEIGCIPSEGYLTGYPLTEDRVYVVARTWGAPEMARPGCIWTHSLFISFTALAGLEEPRALLPFFSRPDKAIGFREYAAPLTVETAKPANWPAIDRDLATEMLWRLYSMPEEHVWLTVRDQRSADATLLAIWGQQWPRLRRNFRYCSLTDADRSTTEHRFDVQFAVSRTLDRRPESMLGKARDNAWIRLCLADLQEHNVALREFLRRAGGDIGGGRARFAELCDLFADRRVLDDVNATERTLHYALTCVPPNEGRLLRGFAIAEAVRLAERLPVETLVDLLPYLDRQGKDLSRASRRVLAERYWQIDPKIFVGPSAPAWLREEIGTVISSLSPKAAIATVVEGGEVAATILRRRTDLLSDPAIWRFRDTSPAIAVLSQISGSSAVRAVLLAMIEASRVDLVGIVCDTFGAERVLRAALTEEIADKEAAFGFASTAFLRFEEKEELVAAILHTRGYRLSRQIVHLFCEHVSPSIPSAFLGDTVDPWANAWVNAPGRISGDRLDTVMTFFLERSLSVSTCDSAALMSLAYDRILDRYLSGKLEPRRRSSLLKHLVASDWFDWSFEGRLRKTIARVAVEKRFSAVQLKAVSKKRRRVSRVIQAVSALKHGKDYLKEIDVTDFR